MKATLRLLPVCLALFLCGFTVVKWAAFENRTGNFKMEFPAKPQQSEKNVNTPSGPLKMYVFMFDGDMADEGNKLYLAMYSDYPEAIISSGKRKGLVDTFFKNAIDGAVANIHGSLVSTESISYKNFPGRKVKASFSEGKGFMDLQMYLVKNRMYFLEVGYQKGQQNTVSEQRFFNSFALLGNKK
jgi:hypothetical protein